MVQKRRQDRAIPLALEGVARRHFQERPGLAVAQGRCLAFVPLGLGALDAPDGVVADRVDLAQVIKQ
jgi:hypothetical protein